MNAHEVYMHVRTLAFKSAVSKTKKEESSIYPLLIGNDEGARTTLVCGNNQICAWRS